MKYVLLIVTCLFIIWTEYSVGNILFRPDSSGKIRMNFSSLFSYLIHPFYNMTLWTWDTLDVNYAFVIGYSLFVWNIFNI